jgi:hypothetical protein
VRLSQIHVHANGDDVPAMHHLVINGVRLGLGVGRLGGLDDIKRL